MRAEHAWCRAMQPRLDMDEATAPDAPGVSRHDTRVQHELAAAEAANEALRRANAELALSRATLAAREQQLRLALDAARMATWEWQLEGDRVSGSPGREALYGQPLGSL